MNKKQTYSIGELAREFDVTTRTIRFYEDQGLVSPARRGQTRVYSPADRVTLKLILRGKRLGFSLAESKELIGMYQPSGDNRHQLLALQNKIRQRRDQLEQQLRDIHALQQELDDAEQRCVDAMNDLEK
ncbi:MerR family DNA-binding transcriptional regulator [Alcanivorax sp. S6407]|uniref:MerR family transcriptional regulator n=1 Tax=Alcanivorax sp. S6407 TaxID=2926424 RepID=UPI001FF1168E|nr:MerR family DNA-binding transcriptional regulator [Alcanivorax sp. S6407]MCK0152356.1 MerR family DNA-binding transcriptional regulator [Alcanivorax sp. S6407]